MSLRRNLLVDMVLPVVVFALALVFAAHSETKTAPETMLADSVGYFDLDETKEKLTDFTRLTDLKAAYDGELNKFAAAQRQGAAAYYADLEQKKDQELAGKNETEKQAIERKYENLARDKATAVNQAVQDKMNELQAKLNEEIVKADGRLRQAVALVAKEKGLKLVLVEAAIYRGGIDVTADVIAKGNQIYKDAQAKKK